MFLNQGCAGRKDRRECKEQPANNGSELLRDDACDGSDQPAEEESNRIFVPLCLLKPGEINFNLHRYFNQKYQSTNAIPNHRGIEQIVIQRAFSL